MEGKKPQFTFSQAKAEDREPTERILRLELEDTGKKKNTVVTGYNPYDRDPVKVPAAKRPASRPDLRKLSEWIKLKKQVDTLKAGDPPQPAEPSESPPPPRRRR